MDASPIEILASFCVAVGNSSSHPACDPAAHAAVHTCQSSMSQADRLQKICRFGLSWMRDLTQSHDDHTMRDSVYVCIFFVKTRSLFSNPQEICSAVQRKRCTVQLKQNRERTASTVQRCSDHKKNIMWKKFALFGSILTTNSTQKEVGLAVM